jgi:hypothetical protein
VVDGDAVLDQHPACRLLSAHEHVSVLSDATVVTVLLNDYFFLPFAQIRLLPQLLSLLSDVDLVVRGSSGQVCVLLDVAQT